MTQKGNRMDAMRDWFDIAPADAVNIVLPREDIRGPLNEIGEPCPWPWDPQQLKGAPMGQYHCPYCSGMQVAGLPHLDWSDPCKTCGQPSWQCGNGQDCAEHELCTCLPFGEINATSVEPPTLNPSCPVHGVEGGPS